MINIESYPVRECVFVHVRASFHISVGSNVAWFFPLLSPSCSHASARGMLHSEQQRHVVMETATALHHRRGRIHPGAGRWKRGAVQGRVSSAGIPSCSLVGIYLSALMEDKLYSYLLIPNRGDFLLYLEDKKVINRTS